MKDAVRRRWNDVRTTAIGGALLVGALAVAALRTNEAVDEGVLRATALPCFALLAIDLGVTMSILRRRNVLAVEIACAVAEALAVTLWIHATGSASGHALLLGPAFVFAYRQSSSPAVAKSAFCAAIAAYTCTFLLEQAGVLAAAPLFRAGPSGIESVPLLRWLAFVVVVALDVAAFVLGAPSSGADEGVIGASPRELGGEVLGGRYRLEEPLGRGASGEVYGAVRLDDRERVAIKILRGVSARSVRRELDAIARLPPNRVARVLDVGEEGDAALIVMERLEGEDLATRLRRRSRLSLAEVVMIVEGLAEVLDAAHDAGIVHRDVKPANVFLAGREGLDVRLLDFGVARTSRTSVATGSRTAHVLGSPGYLAPEQVSDGHGPIGPATDVFALGALVYRALTGHAAFPARQPSAAIYEALHRHPPPPSSYVEELSEDVDAVIEIALAKDTKARFGRASELLAHLRDAQHGRLDPAVRERAAALRSREDLPGETITAA